MSFGFGVGDFIAVGTLCWKLYQNVYKVSRDAPEELRGIRDELGALSNTIRLLNDDIQDPHSVLKQPGQENRFDLAAEIMKSTNDTLQKLQVLAEKHELLRTQSTGGSRRQYLKIQWDKLKFAKEWSAITDLRAKLLYHNNQLSLLLQVLNNSSLERLQKEEQRTQKLIEDVHMAVYGTPNSGSKVTTAPFLNTRSVEELTKAFLMNAQSGRRPWATIGMDSWLQAGRWWLIKAQSLLNTAHPGSPEYYQAFVDLLKSSWILTNVISMHPQRKLIVSTDPRDHIIEGLAQALKEEHDKLAVLPLPELSLEQLRSADLTIWAPAKITSLMPGKYFSRRMYARFFDGKPQLTLHAGLSFAYQVYPESVIGIECILILEVQSQRRSVTFIAQGVDGQDIIRVPLYSEVDYRVLVKLSDISALRYKERHLENTITYIDPLRGIQLPPARKMNYNYETAFRLVNTEFRDILSAFSLGLCFLRYNFKRPPIDIRSLEAAAVLSYSSEKVDVLRRFGSLTALPFRESSTQTDQLCTLASQAMRCFRDGSSVGLPTFLRPDISLFTKSNSWPYIIWLSPTAEHAISLARSTDSVQLLKDSVFDCMRSSFVKGCPVFFDKLLKFFDIQAQGRLEWTMDHDFNPEGLHFSDFRLLTRAILRSGDHLLFNSILELACSSIINDPAFVLGDALLEAAISADKIGFERVITNPMVTNYISSDYDEQGIGLLVNLLSKGLQEFPVKGLQWLLDLLPKVYLPSRDIEKRVHGLSGQPALRKGSPPIASMFGSSLEAFISGRRTPHRFELNNVAFIDVRGLWIIPALLRQDREIVDLILDRDLGQLHPLSLHQNWDGSSVKIRIPPVGMPDLPLYCAIFLAFESEFILFLCERGARISDTASSGQPQPAIIEHLISLLTVDQARQSFKRTSKLISNSFKWEDVYLNNNSNMRFIGCILSFDIAQEIVRKQYTWVAQIWRIMQVREFEEEPGDSMVEAELPSPLQTQENWDEWRTEVLRILREYHAKSHGA